MTNYQQWKISTLLIVSFFVYYLPDGFENAGFFTGSCGIHRVDTKGVNSSNSSPFSKDSLRANIENLLQSLDAKAGVSLLHIENRDTLNYKGGMHLPMLSVYKFPIAMAVLERVDKGKMKMEQSIEIAKKLIHPGDEETFSAKNFPGAKATIKELLSLMLVYGSNTACDILLHEIKGPEKVQQYIRRLGIKQMVIANTERDIQTDASIKYKNWSTTNEMVKLLAIAHQQNVLSKNSYSFLWDKMTASVTGPGRIKGLLSKDTEVAHRTGTGENAYNDAGIIGLPNGKHLAIAVFIADAKVDPDACNRVIAQISKWAYDYYTNQ